MTVTGWPGAQNGFCAAITTHQVVPSPRLLAGSAVRRMLADAGVCFALGDRVQDRELAVRLLKARSKRTADIELDLLRANSVLGGP